MSRSLDQWEKSPCQRTLSVQRQYLNTVQSNMDAMKKYLPNDASTNGLDGTMVYALHTFHAAGPGQVSVNRGEPLLILNDQHAYWWLVRVLHTLEVGYLPSENIETPGERLAQLNKHRNVQLTRMPTTATKTTNKKTKKVTLSSFRRCQLPVITMDDLGEEKLAYEEWEEDVPSSEPWQFCQPSSSIRPCGTPPPSRFRLRKRSPIPYPVIDTVAAVSQGDNKKAGPVVMRIFSGNIPIHATYHCLLVDETTNAEELVKQAMQRFRLPPLDKQDSIAADGGVEYYISMTVNDQDAVILVPQDKPLMMYRSLTCSSSTPVPTALPQELVDTKQHMTNRTTDGCENTAVRFYLNKRIKRENNGQLCIKLIYQYAMFPEPRGGDSHGRRPPQRKRLGFYKRVSPAFHEEQVEKMVMASPKLSIGELTRIAMEKFHLCDKLDDADDSAAKYRLTLLISNNDGREKLFLPTRQLGDVVQSACLSDHDKRSPELTFILRHMSRSYVADDNPLMPKKSNRQIAPFKPKHTDEIFDTDPLERVDTALQRIIRDS
ncbi:uncharacterized protein BYT42DRAFT_615651 [Radiomyces spectabilis]|uniref:uncharacterized protein n=1 Tax=Radiomyces spectabilis TaxID=64574 RepID=UPI0022200227|nr:uncharacterized protein BYT42DRAFT_615651 [Radiomyces spectabilis]KAI8374492.1 hypothetical protein BYT42DRAFT_615651 [Radiomyces spectabilis]